MISQGGTRLTKRFALIASLMVFVVTIAFAGWASYLTSQSMAWFQDQSTKALAMSRDPVASAFVLTVYSGFVKKQLALGIAAMLALLGLGLSLSALEKSSEAAANGPGGISFSVSSVSPGVCAFIAATVIVVVVVLTRDSFGAVPQSVAPETASASVP